MAEATQVPPRLLFVPVSGPYGMGEYARSVAIARGVRERWPAAAVHFLLSRQAPYAADAPFPHTLLPSSPTFHSSEVVDCLREFRPDLVIFDNAGRTAQLRAAKRLGAGVVYISSRRRQRGKAFRWRWMRLIDEHWIAYPEFIAGPLNPLERLKLAVLHRPRLRYLDVILSAPDEGAGPALRARIGWEAGTFVLVVPGGGTGHPGALDAVAHFHAAAHSLAATGVPTIYVGPADGGSEPTESLLRVFRSLPQPELAELLRAARLVVANGGSTLLQGIACGRACVAIPIARDQRERIRRCVAGGVAAAAPADAAGIARRATELWRDEPARAALADRAAALSLADGVDVAVRAIGELLRRMRGAIDAG